MLAAGTADTLGTSGERCAQSYRLWRRPFDESFSTPRVDRGLGVIAGGYDPVVALAPDLERNRGKWVAFDEQSERVLAAADSAEALYEILDRTDLPMVTVWRVPRLDEPLYIGLG